MNYNLKTDLSGKTAVVTGAGGILCGMFAKALAAAGAKVAVLDLNEAAAEKVAAEICAEGGVAKAYKCNVLEKASLTSTRAVLNLFSISTLSAHCFQHSHLQKIWLAAKAVQFSM